MQLQAKKHPRAALSIGVAFASPRGDTKLWDVVLEVVHFSAVFYAPNGGTTEMGETGSK